MKAFSSWTFSALGVIGLFALTALLYPGLPELVPTHWDAAGRVDGMGTKSWGAWLLPVMSAAIAGLRSPEAALSRAQKLADHLMEPTP